MSLIVDFPCKPRIALKSQDAVQVAPTFAHLIVDFPSKPRIAPKNQGFVPATPTIGRPRVQFSQLSQLVMIPNDAHPKWYTREEERCFKWAVSDDADRVRKLLRDATPDLIDVDILYKCVGLEKFLFRSSHIVNMKRTHSDVVLAAQRIHQGNDKIEKISKTSMMSSRCARERAAEVAAHYARCL